jgi:Spy/CpxP family protein refolding chaperone
MNRRRAITIAAAAIFAVPAFHSAYSQQAEAPAAAPHSMPNVDDHLHMLAQKLDLSEEQQSKARPIITEMQDEMQKITDDKSLTHDEAMAKTHATFMNADKKFREFLTDEQKTKLDAMEAEMHHEKQGTGNRD